MRYKTIVLELLQDQPELYERLRSSKRLLPTARFPSLGDSPFSDAAAPPGPSSATLPPPPDRSITGLALRNGDGLRRHAAKPAGGAVSAAPGELTVARASGQASVDRSGE